MKRNTWIALVAAPLLLAAAWFGYRTVSAQEALEARVAAILTRTDTALSARDPRDESVRVLRDLDAMRDLPRDRRLLVARARLNWGAGNADTAAQLLSDAAQLQPLSAEESMLLGRLQERRFCVVGDESAGPLALHSFQRAAEDGGQPAAWYATLRMALRLGNQELAGSIRERLLREADSVPARRLLASQAVGEGRFDEALRLLDEVVGDYDDEAELHLECVQCLLQGSQPDLRRARLEMESALRLYPGLVPARTAAVALFHILGDKAARDGHLDWLIRTQPTHPDRREWETLRASPAGVAASRPGK